MIEHLPKNLRRGKSIIYIDFENVLCNTDPFVMDTLNNIYIESKVNGDEKEYLKNISDIYGEIEKNTKKYIACVKDNPNVINDFNIDDNLSEYDCDDLKNVILYADYETSLEGEITLTKLGGHIKNYLGNEDCEKIYVYCKSVTEALHSLIFSFFDTGDDRVCLLDGDRSEFLQTIPCTAYFIEQVDELYAICHPHYELPEIREVYIPAFRFNMDEEGNLLSFDHPSNILEEFKTQINIVDLPII